MDFEGKYLKIMGESEIRNLEFGIWNLESGIWNLESGIWNLENLQSSL
jgi:hypothetical protein